MLEFRWADDEPAYLKPMKRKILLVMGLKRYHFSQKQAIAMFLQLNKLIGKKAEARLAKGQGVTIPERKSKSSLLDKYMENRFPSLSVLDFPDVARKVLKDNKKRKEKGRKTKRMKETLNSAHVDYLPH